MRTGSRVVYWPFGDEMPEGGADSHRGIIVRFDVEGRAVVRWDNGITEPVELDDLTVELRSAVSLARVAWKGEA